MNNLDIARVFGRLIDKRLKITNMIANQKDAPVPKRIAGNESFATVFIGTKTNEGWDAEVYSDDPEFDGLKEDLRGRRRITASINFYRNKSDYDVTAMDLAEEFRTYLESSEAMSEFLKSNMGLITVSNARDLTAINVRTFEGRAQIDVECYVASILTTNVLDIQQATVSGEVENTGIDDINLIITE